MESKTAKFIKAESRRVVYRGCRSRKNGEMLVRGCKVSVM
jgi:hypothetical protein